MKHNRNFKPWLLTMALVSLVLAGCNAYGPKPTPAQSPTPKPTAVPAATLGPLASVQLEKLGLSLQAPSSWAAPTILNDNSAILSPDGSTDTSSTAGPFLLIMLGDDTFFHSRLSFPKGLTDSVDQLNAIVKALNIDAPEISPVTAYKGARYPGAMVRMFERGLERTIVLLKVDASRWLYLGAQSQEKYFAYYDGLFFVPATESIMLTTPASGIGAATGAATGQP